MFVVLRNRPRMGKIAQLEKIKIKFKGSSDQIHFIFENNVEKSRMRHTTTPKLNF